MRDVPTWQHHDRGSSGHDNAQAFYPPSPPSFTLAFGSTPTELVREHPSRCCCRHQRRLRELAQPVPVPVVVSIAAQIRPAMQRGLSIRFYAYLQE